MKFCLEVGEVEKNVVEFNFDQLLGQSVIKVNQKEVKRAVRLFNEPRKETHTLQVGEGERLMVRIEKERLLWQPQWKAAQRMKVKLADAPALRKKTVIALARQLAIDLWRWRTGRCTLADLGWIAA